MNRWITECRGHVPGLPGSHLRPGPLAARTTGVILSFSGPGGFKSLELTLKLTRCLLRSPRDAQVFGFLDLGLWLVVLFNVPTVPHPPQNESHFVLLHGGTRAVFSAKSDVKMAAAVISKVHCVFSVGWFLSVACVLCWPVSP